MRRAASQPRGSRELIADEFGASNHNIEVPMVFYFAIRLAMSEIGLLC
jgi:hypothetical protein